MKLQDCLRRRGISLQKPDKNLAESYLEKARITITEVEKLNDNSWKIVLLYYAAYFSAYSVLVRYGIKSEIHACTFIALERTGMFTNNEIAKLRQAAKDRVLLQYYADNSSTLERVEELHMFARDLLVKCRTISVNENNISSMRNKLSR